MIGDRPAPSPLGRRLGCTVPPPPGGKGIFLLLGEQVVACYGLVLALSGWAALAPAGGALTDEEAVLGAAWLWGAGVGGALWGAGALAPDGRVTGVNATAPCSDGTAPVCSRGAAPLPVGLF